MASTTPLYRTQELAFRTQYAELKERTRAAGKLLVGTPGTLAKRSGTGYDYWYRVYYPVPNTQSEELVGSADDGPAYRTMRERIEFSRWVSKQVANLRQLQFQVADKKVASVLVELHNRGIFQAGLIVVGTLAYMSWLNEYGAISVAVRTQDIDLARGQRLKLGAPVPFLSSVQATHLPFTSIPGMPSDDPSTSVKLPGREGLRVDVLAPGSTLGATIQVPELAWHAQTIPHYDYLLDDSRQAAILAGGHCIPVALPNMERMIWHKLYSSTKRTHEPEKADKDLIQAVTLAAIIVEQNGVILSDSFHQAPQALRAATMARIPRIHALLAQHPEARDAFGSLSIDRYG
jgi:hypothetical protein